ncbi:MAG: InlB B-repeat-containing protein [Clostridia bacterium]|nr:InlB B-repeat-containing protein [Clostridia bacterium]
MKRVITIFICCMLLALVLVSCDAVGDIVSPDITIKFDSAGGSLVNEQKIEKSSKITEPKDPKKIGYEFLGWYVGDERWSFIGYIATEDMTLTAKWELITYEIKYELGENAVNGNNPTTYTIKDKIELEDPAREGYTFEGWYLDKELTVLADNISANASNITLYAKWSEGEALKYDYTMSDYITLPSLDDLTVDFELDMLQSCIDSYLMQYATENDEKTEAELGDVVDVSYKGYLLDESDNPLSEPFNESENAKFYLGSHIAIDDFENGIIGAQKGQEVEFYATFPSDHETGNEALDLKGKKVLFKVTLNSIYDAPKYNDEFVQAYFDEYTTTKELEDAIINDYILAEVYEYISENSVVKEYPTKELNAINSELEESEANFEETYGMTLDEYLMQSYNMTRDEYIKSNMKNEMIYYAYAQQKEIVPTEEMLALEKERLVAYYKNHYMSFEGMNEEDATKSATDFVNELGEDYIYDNVLYGMVEKAWCENTNVNIIEKTYTSVSESSNE